MDRLRATQDSTKHLIGYANEVVVRLLGGVGAPRGLDMEAELPAPGVLGSIAIPGDGIPHSPPCPQLRNLLKEIVMGSHIEGEGTNEIVQGYSSAALLLFDTADGIGQEHPQLLDGIDALFPVVIGIEVHRMPIRSNLTAPLDAIHDDTKLVSGSNLVWTPQISANTHNIIVGGTTKSLYVYALFLRHNKIHRS